jgi:hypothetical protein
MRRSRKPENFRVLVDAARAFGTRYQFDRADEIVRQLVRLRRRTRGSGTRG